MKYFSWDRLCNFNIHYDTLYSLEYFCRQMQTLGVKNVELSAGNPSLFSTTRRSPTYPPPRLC